MRFTVSIAYTHMHTAPGVYAVCAIKMLFCADCSAFPCTQALQTTEHRPTNRLPSVRQTDQPTGIGCELPARADEHE